MTARIAIGRMGRTIIKTLILIVSLLSQPASGGNPILFTQNQVAPTGALVAWWKFESASYNGTAGEVFDSAGNSLHGTAQSAANTTAAGKNGRGLTLNGTTDYVLGTTPTQLDFGTGNHSIALWLKTTGNTMAPFAKFTSSYSNGGYGFYITSGGKIRYRMYVNNAQVESSDSSTVINDGSWHHILVTVNRTGNVVIYVDGVADSTTNIATYSAYSSTSNIPFTIGARGNSTQFFSGQIDDVAIWNRVLTPAEISNVHTGQPY